MAELSWSGRWKAGPVEMRSKWSDVALPSYQKGEMECTKNAKIGKTPHMIILIGNSNL